MQREEWEASAVCALCGSPVSGVERPFVYGTENVLCAGCARARGGRYDAQRDCWVAAPSLSELPDEAYGVAPHEHRRG